MTVNLKDSIELLIAIVSVVLIGYRISKVEAAIYSAMDNIQDDIIEELRKLQRDYSVHLADYSARKEWQDAVIHQLDGKIDHKFHRLYQNQRDIQQYLEKSGFKIRQFGEENDKS